MLRLCTTEGGLGFLLGLRLRAGHTFRSLLLRRLRMHSQRAHFFCQFGRLCGGGGGFLLFLGELALQPSDSLASLRITCS